MLQKLPTDGFSDARLRIVVRAFGVSRNDVVRHSFVAARDSSFHSSPCFCQFIRM